MRSWYTEDIEHESALFRRTMRSRYTEDIEHGSASSTRTVVRVSLRAWPLAE
jgi:hypothetical protein